MRISTGNRRRRTGSGDLEADEPHRRSVDAVRKMVSPSSIAYP